jgi:hypothetical protein
MNPVNIPPVDSQALERKSTDVVTKANSLRVHDPATYEAAGDAIQNLLLIKAEIDNAFTPIVRKCHQAHQEAKATQKKFIGPIEKAENRLREQLGAYTKQAQANKAEEKKTGVETAEPTLVPKVKGISNQTTWRAVVTDKAALIKAVAEGKIGDDVLEPNMVVLNKLARALKKQLDVPGVVAEDKVSVTVKKRR